MATERRFDPITVPVEGGGRRRVHRIQCSECPTHHDVSANTFGGSRNHDDLMKVLKRGSWEVGRNPSRDLCPDCASAKRRKPKAETMSVVPMTKPAAEPPAQPTFEDRRIIIAKLQEVYIDEKVGYDRGWSDKRVGEHLGVPWKWVADLREANFGPARDNDDVREALAEARQLAADCEKAVKEAQAFIKRLDAERDAIAAQRLQVDTVLRIVQDRQSKIERRIAEIEKAVR